MDDRMVDQSLHNEESSFEFSLRPTKLKQYIGQSSINKTSPGCKPDKIAAKSPGRSNDGPDTVLILTSISLAIIFESVVLPNPGGPKSNT